MPELLIELLSEEIPARMQARAARDLEKQVNDRLIAAGFMPEGVRAFSGPRRLTLSATGLPARQPDRRDEKKGPRVGAPEKAVAGFLKSAGLSSLDDCEVREDKKGEYYVAVIDQKGRDTADLIADMVPEIVRGFSWPKSMRWGAASEHETSLKWVRPLKSILCAFDGEIVPLDIDGVASSDKSRGHRFMDNREFQARNFEKYEAELRAAKVMLDGEARAHLIDGEAKALCEAQGLELVEDKALLNEVAGLAEWPVVMIGQFDEKFLSVPDEVLTASMRGHQKYFSVRDPKENRLANRFVFVANLEAPDGGAAMRIGYERVLTARLSDAWYLYQQDLKTPLPDRSDDLEKITFFEGLGSVGDKVNRVAAVAKDLAPAVGADPAMAERAARLAKADLVTGMVYEFPELQGVMGRYYAIEQGEAIEVADAIRDHYKPQGQDDGVPTAPVSMAVALADKIDTLKSFWSIDKKPTGSSDPFALRRAALGVIQIVLENEIRIKIPSSPGDLLSFFHDRLKVYLRDDGYRHDHIDAVLHDSDGAPLDDFVLLARRLKALRTLLQSDDGANLVAAYKRAANILKAEEKKGDVSLPDTVEEARLEAVEEKVLFENLQSAEKDAKAFVVSEDFEGAMTALARLREPLDAFFENVTVNADDTSLRANRLALLKRVTASVSTAADLSKLEG